MVLLNLRQKKILKKVMNKNIQVKHNQTFAKKRMINLMKKRVITLVILGVQLLLNLILHFQKSIIIKNVLVVFQISHAQNI